MYRAERSLCGQARQLGQLGGASATWSHGSSMCGPKSTSVLDPHLLTNDGGTALLLATAFLEGGHFQSLLEKAVTGPHKPCFVGAGKLGRKTDVSNSGILDAKLDAPGALWV